MRDTSLLIASLISIFALGVLHFVAGAFYLYWTIGWFDYLMHFLAGLGGGLFVVWLISNKVLSGAQVVSIVFVSVMLVGVVWEIFEYMNDIAQSTEGYALDTFHDLLMDALGSLVVGIVSIKRLNI